MNDRPRRWVRIYRDRGGGWRWSLVAANGEIVADGAEDYATRSGATEAVEREFPDDVLKFDDHEEG